MPAFCLSNNDTLPPTFFGGKGPRTFFILESVSANISLSTARPRNW